MQRSLIFIFVLLLQAQLTPIGSPIRQYNPEADLLAPKSSSMAVPYDESTKFKANLEIAPSGHVGLGALDQQGLNPLMGMGRNPKTEEERKKSASVRLYIANELLKSGISAVLLNWNTVTYMQRERIPSELRVPAERVLLRIEGDATGEPAFLEPEIFLGVSTELTEAIRNKEVDKVIPKIAERMKDLKEKQGIYKFKINVYWNWMLPEHRELSEFQLEFIKAVARASEAADVWLVAEVLYYDKTGDNEAKIGDAPDYERQMAYDRRHGANVIRSAKLLSEITGIDLMKLEFPGNLTLVDQGQISGEELNGRLQRLEEISQDKPWVVLSAGKPFEMFGREVDGAIGPGGATGFLAGRSFYKDAFVNNALDSPRLVELVPLRVPQINRTAEANFANSAVQNVARTLRLHGAQAAMRLFGHYRDVLPPGVKEIFLSRVLYQMPAVAVMDINDAARAGSIRGSGASL